MARDNSPYLSDDSDLTDVPDLVEDKNHPDSEDLEGWTSTTDVGPDTPSGDEFLVGPTRKRKPAPLQLEVSGLERSNSRSFLRSRKRKAVVRDAPLSPIESLPNEIIQKIATNVETDTGLCNLSLSSPSFLHKLDDAESEVWRKRFLARYDHPIIDSSLDFRTAYKLRRLVLKNFVSFANGMKRRAHIQLEVLRDMVLETYYNPKPWESFPVVSRNLKALESPATSPWIATFLSSPFPACTEKKRWGEPDAFFETMQLVLSHLLLSPKSALSHLAASSRENYDLVRVYNFNQPLTTLYTCLSSEEPPASPFQSSMFPKLKPSNLQSPVKTYRLDTTSLLHIRNFWHRHLIDDSHPVGEHTYADMMRELSRMNKTPQKWDQALESDIEISSQWFGHYSCVNPWPKAREDLVEMQSCAEDWDHVDPLMLDLVTSDKYSEGFWPPAFSTIPAFDSTIVLPPESSNPEWSVSDLDQRKHKSKSNRTTTKHCFPKREDRPIYIRGIATFIDTKQQKENAQSTSTASTSPTAEQAQQKYLKYHPFTALRVRGVIHDIPPAATVDNAPDAKNKAIPGWKRIVMIMYKPNITYLINVLEHAAEEYGGAFATQVTNQLNTANVWGATAGSANNNDTTTTTNTNLNTNTNTTVPTNPDTTTTTTIPQLNPSPIPPTLTPQTLHHHLQTRLYDLLTSSSSSTPFTTPQINALESQYLLPHYTSWEPDMLDFAYAYEGAILPGGKIMMGRWWRCHGLTGLGVGWEVDGVGEGVDDPGEGESEGEHENENENVGVSVDTDGNAVGNQGASVNVNANVNANVNGNGRRRRQLERGPFMFCC